jgi:3-oxoacyl-[acyl-carrier protein] reductase
MSASKLVLDLQDRVALVTGGSRGIGEAIALTLARAGARVAVGVNRESGRAARVVKTIRSEGGEAMVVDGDLAEAETADQYVLRTTEAFGGLDILVNNAGIWEESSIETLTEEFLERTLSVNLKSVFRLCRAAAPHLAGSHAGRIVNISSTASLMGEPLHSPYSASKGALDALTRSLAVELGPSGITVNSVAPGWTITDMTEDELGTESGKRLVESIPLRKVAFPEDVAYAVAFLAGDWAGHVNGVTLPVDGAYRIRR